MPGGNRVQSRGELQQGGGFDGKGEEWHHRQASTPPKTPCEAATHVQHGGHSGGQEGLSQHLTCAVQPGAGQPSEEGVEGTGDKRARLQLHGEDLRVREAKDATK